MCQPHETDGRNKVD